MTRLIHTADWQIGTQFGSFSPEHAPLLAEARLETVAAIARLADEREADAVLVAGDVFDFQTVSKVLIRATFDAMSAYKGPWLLLPGNHDAALSQSVWTTIAQMKCAGTNVHMVTKPGVVELPAANIAVLAAPLVQRHTYEDVTAFFDAQETPAGTIRVGLAHGAVNGILPGDLDSANPIAADRARSANLDYLALGDWHGTFEVNERTWYAGTPEQDRFKGNDPGNVLEVTLAAPGVAPVVQAVRVGKFRWLQWDETLRLETDVEALADRVATLTKAHVLDITVRGDVTLAVSDALARVLEIAQSKVRAYREDISALKLEPSALELAKFTADGGYLGKAVARLQSLQAVPANGKVASEALRLLVQLKSRSEVAA